MAWLAVRQSSGRQAGSVSGSDGTEVDKGNRTLGKIHKSNTQKYREAKAFGQSNCTTGGELAKSVLLLLL